MQKKPNDFTQGPILRPLLAFTIPMLFAILLQNLYASVDVIMIGRFCTAAEVSAVVTGSQIIRMVTVMVTGLGTGTMVLLGQKVGKGDLSDAGDAAGSAMCLFGLGAVALSVLSVLGAPVLARWMQAPAESFEAAVAYVRICGAGCICMVAYNVLGSMLRGTGDSKTPLLAVAVACAANVVLDLLFVGVLSMGVTGVALATVLAQLLSVVVTVALLRRKGLPFEIKRSQLRLRKNVIAQNMKIGLPLAAQDFLINYSFVALTAIVNTLGVTASAGVGVADKLSGFIMLLPAAFVQSMSAFVAQNAGAKQWERAKKAMLCGMAVSALLSVPLSWLGFFRGEMLASLYSADAQINQAAAQYLKACAIDALLASVVFCFVGYYSGCGETGFVMTQSLICAFGVRVPFAWLMSRLTGNVFLVGLASPVCSAVQIVVCTIWFLRKQRKNKKRA